MKIAQVVPFYVILFFLVGCTYKNDKSIPNYNDLNKYQEFISEVRSKGRWIEVVQ